MASYHNITFSFSDPLNFAADFIFLSAAMFMSGSMRQSSSGFFDMFPWLMKRVCMGVFFFFGPILFGRG